MFASFFLFVATLAIVFAGDTSPTQVHIALAGSDPSGTNIGLAISWQTTVNTVSSVVKFGTVSGRYDYELFGSSSAYYETFHHHVLLSKLEPSTQYFYIVGDETGGFSKEFSAISAPTQDSRNFSFGVYGDLGLVNGGSSISMLKKWVASGDVNLLVHSGDVSYADDAFLHKECAFSFCFEKTWDQYMNDIEEFASKVPYMVAAGNHEADCHDPACLTDKQRRQKLSNFTAYNTRFRMPSAESQSSAMNMWYSFNYGSVHFITVDTETGFAGAPLETRYVLPCGGFGDQLAWLENDLKVANANRANRPWIFVQGHRPMYQGEEINEPFQAAMEDLFYEYGVDIYFSGHVHHYERNLPVYKGIPTGNASDPYNNPAETTYLMIGGAGNDEMDDSKVVDPSPVERLIESDAPGPWTAVTDEGSFGIGKISIIDDSHLTFQYYRTTASEIFDSFTLTRDHSKYIEKFRNKYLRGLQ